MEKEFVPYDLALRMKKLGFEEDCIASYRVLKILMLWPEITTLGTTFKAIKNSNITDQERLKDMVWKEECTAPTWNQAFSWFRDNYGLWFRPDYYTDLKDYGFQGNIHELGKYSSIADLGDYKTPKELELACLEKMIKIVEESKK